MPHSVKAAVNIMKCLEDRVNTLKSGIDPEDTDLFCVFAVFLKDAFQNGKFVCMNTSDVWANTNDIRNILYRVVFAQFSWKKINWNVEQMFLF